MIEVCSGGPSKDNRNNGSENVKVYQAINKVQAALAKSGITKDKRNQQQGYNFRGIDDVYNALAPLLAEHGLCILPRVLSRHCDERQTAKGSAIFYVTVEAEFDFVCAEDGSKHTVKTFGEAMDSADKATNKAMSAAYKYAAFQAFAIPTEADNDADAHTHQVQPRQAPPVDPGAIEKAVQWIAASKSIDVAKHRGMSAISRFTDPQDHERINAAVTEYEQAAMAGA